MLRNANVGVNSMDLKHTHKLLRMLTAYVLCMTTDVLCLSSL